MTGRSTPLTWSRANWWSPIELLEPFDGDTSPSFTTVGDLLYLTDRVNGRVIEFNLDHGHEEAGVGRGRRASQHRLCRHWRRRSS